MDPNINLNWYKVYTKAGGDASKLDALQSSENSLQQIAAAMAMADLKASGDLSEGQTISLVDSNGQPILQTSNLLDSATQLSLLYECPLCFKSVDSKDAINRHLLYHAINEYYEYDIQCSACTKQLAPSAYLAECLLHTREFRSHRLSISFYKYVLSSVNSSNSSSNNSGVQQPMVACVLCGFESTNLMGCIQHIMLDHFSYDSNTIRMKRFVNFMLNKLNGSGATTSAATTAPQTTTTALSKASLKALNNAAAQKQKQLQIQQNLLQAQQPLSKQVMNEFFETTTNL
jgi:hypothetical protein